MGWLPSRAHVAGLLVTDRPQRPQPRGMRAVRIRRTALIWLRRLCVTSFAGGGRRPRPRAGHTPGLATAPGPGKPRVISFLDAALHRTPR
jgi:hypothetical protein